MARRNCFSYQSGTRGAGRKVGDPPCLVRGAAQRRRIGQLRARGAPVRIASQIANGRMTPGADMEQEPSTVRRVGWLGARRRWGNEGPFIRGAIPRSVYGAARRGSRTHESQRQTRWSVINPFILIYHRTPRALAEMRILARLHCALFGCFHVQSAQRSRLRRPAIFRV